MTNSPPKSTVSSAFPSPSPVHPHHASHAQTSTRAFLKVFSIPELSDHILSLVRSENDIKCLRQVSHLFYELCLPFFKLSLSEFLFLSRSPSHLDSAYWHLQQTQHLIRHVELTHGNPKFIALLLSAPKKTPVFHRYLASPLASNDVSRSSASEESSCGNCSKGVGAKQFERGALTVPSLMFTIDAVDKQEVFSCLDRFWNLRELDVVFKSSTSLTPTNLMELLTLGLEVDGNENHNQRFNLAHTLESFRMHASRGTVRWNSFHLFLRTFPRLKSVALDNIMFDGFESLTPLSSPSLDPHSPMPNVTSLSYQSPMTSGLPALLIETFPNLKELSILDLSDMWRYDSSDTALPLTSGGQEPALIPFQYLERLISFQVRHPPPRQGSTVDYGAQDSWKWRSFPPGLVDLEMESNDNNSILARRWMQQLTQQLEQSGVHLRSLRLGKLFESGEILLSSTICHELQHLEILMGGTSVFNEVWRRGASLVQSPTSVSSATATPSSPPNHPCDSSASASALLLPPFQSESSGGHLETDLTESDLEMMEETGGTIVPVTVDSVRSRIPFVKTLRTLKLRNISRRGVRKLPLSLLLQCMSSLEEFDLQDSQHVLQVFSKLKGLDQDRQRLLPSLRVLKVQVENQSAALAEDQLLDLFKQLEDLRISKVRLRMSEDQY